MQLDKVAVVLRPRQGWEAVDLGFRMAAHWARPLWGVWAAVYLPLAVALILALRTQPWLAALLLWWLKPLGDRWVLHVLSRAVFGEVPRLTQTLAAWREVLRPGLAWALLARLWDYARSFALPVVQLERQQGKAAAARRRLLIQRVGGQALGLTFVCACFEAVVLYGLYALAGLFGTDVQWSRDGSGDLWSHLATAQEWWTWRDTAAYVLAISLVEPFYVAGGFALYLNRRVLLEGWDVEVALRRLTARHAARQGTFALLLVLVLGGAVALPLRAQTLYAAAPAAAPAQADRGAPPSADRGADAASAAAGGEDAGGRADRARTARDGVGAGPGSGVMVHDTAAADDTVSDDPAGDDPASDDAADAAAKNDTGMCPAPYAPQDTPAQRAAREVLADPVFGSRRRERRWVAIERADQAARRTTPGATFGKVMKVLAEVLRVVAWVAIAAMVVIVLVLILRRWQGRAPAAARSAAPTQLFGLAIHPDSLPPDIPVAARALLAEGRRREALSLLYRGALSHLVHERGLAVRRGATEGDVLALAQRALPQAPAAYFGALLPVWTEAAYAARLPEAERVEALCAQHATAMPRAAAAGGVA